MENNNDNLDNVNDINDVDEKKEPIYQKLIAMMNSLECMTVTPSKTEMLLAMVNKFSELQGYKDSDEYIRLCKQSAEQTNAELNEKIYSYAQEKKRKARTANDYKIAANEFRKISNFMDAKTLALECDRLSVNNEKKSTRNTFLSMGVLLLAILAIILISVAPIAKYNIARALFKVEAYTTASKLYTKLGDYKDSEKRIIECDYKIGLKSEKEGDYAAAQKAFATAGNYKDSDSKKVAALKQLLKNSTPGSTIKIGSFNWLVLEIQDSQILLVKKTAIQDQPYNLSLQDITWENSSLRKYLNTDFLKTTFSKEEQNNILPTNIANNDNTVYGTDSGNDTVDSLFVLSIEEADKYMSVFKNFKSNSWLRTSGNTADSAAFISYDGAVMDYGYNVTSIDFTAAPALWFNIN